MGTTAQKLQAIVDSKVDIASAIEERGGTVPATLAEYGDAIRNLPSGGDDQREQADVVFIDYDGTLLHSMTAAEARALTTLPAVPTHTDMFGEGWDLVADGWNYTLAEIITELDAGLKVTVGCTYHTSDGASRIYIDNTDERLPLGITQLCVVVCQSGQTVTVDFGDGFTDTATATKANHNFNAFAHTYSQRGQYTIKFSVPEGHLRWDTGLFNKSDAVQKCLFSSLVTKAYFGNNVEYISGQFLVHGENLEEIALPKPLGSGASIWSSVFSNCLKLKGIVVPSGIEGVWNNAFYMCYSMRFASIPRSVTQIGASSGTGGGTFERCASLRRLDVPSSIGAVLDSSGTHFAGLTSVRQMRIPSGMTNACKSVVANNTAMEKVVFDCSIASFTNTYVSNCIGLKEIVFNGQVDGITQNAFSYLPNLTKIVFNGNTSVPSLGNVSAFAFCPFLRQIIVPDDLYSAWIAATNWSSTTNNIMPSIVGAGSVGIQSVEDLALAAGVQSISDDTTMGDIQTALNLADTNTVQDAIDAVS